MKLGARLLKTGAAIAVSLWIASALGLEPPAYAAIAAIAAIQPSIYKSYQSIVTNVRGSLIGAVVASLFYFLVGNTPFIIGLVVVIVMAVQLKFKTDSSITLPAVTVIAIMAGTPTGHFLVYAFKRLSLALVGAGSSFAVNLLFGPPKFEVRLFRQIVHNSEEIIKSLRLISRHETSDAVLKEDLHIFRENRQKAEQLYDLFKEERTLRPKQQIGKGRKLVLFRQMIQSNQLALEVLRSLHHNENDFRRAPDVLRLQIREQLECLINFHEQLLLKFSGKTRTDVPTELTGLMDENRSSLSGTFMAYYEKEQEKERHWLHLFPVVASIIEYQDHLNHLDKLIDPFVNYHKEADAADWQAMQ
ncbi:MAG TPA: aromatic acid exporter family protein [Bacillales bacterium]|nr:aromatic acid exporter family protein [Bacillales bacterium]